MTLLADRKLVLDMVQRMCEAEEMARNPATPITQRQYWIGRARAFDEVYTELKGLGYAGT
jgi:hypothetical protein